jgi:hypothetical protein
VNKVLLLYAGLKSLEFSQAELMRVGSRGAKVTLN